MPISAAEQTAGFGAKALIRKAFELAKAPYDETRVDALYQPFLVRYAERIADESHLYDGVVDVLTLLKSDGWRLGICTNKPESLAIALMARLGVNDRFAALLGADTLPVRKPDPRHLFETIERIGGTPEQAVMIGDTDTDLKTARNAEIPCILTTFGYSNIPVARLKPDVIVDRFDQIPDALETCLRSRRRA
ncbi:UNVERIFIED_CONTAM: hypothetical protein GTU68_063733 [Idotea baltica]|nr:hypothetical protein [Idotea baltica]